MPAENFLPIHWSVDDGLSQDETYCLLQDVSGFLWVGTRQGVNRFDGHMFKTYTENNGKKGVTGNDIVSLVEDSLHHIWIGTNKGASRYDIKADTFTHFSPVSDTTHFKTIIPFWATGSEVFCVENGLFVTSYNSKTLKKKVWVNMKGAAGVGPWNDSRSVYDAASNSVWLFASGKDGLYKVSLSTGRIELHEWRCVKPQPEPHINPIHWKGAEDMVYDRKRNSIWINSLDGLIQFTLADQRFRSPEALKEIVSLKDYDYWPGINIDRHGRIWFGTQPKGILIYDPETRIVTMPFPKDAHLQKEVSDGTMRIFFDKHDIAWVGYWLRKGFYQLNPSSQTVTRNHIDTTGEQALYSDDVFHCVYAGNDKMWIASAKGLCIYDIRTGAMQLAKENNLGFPVVIDTSAGKAWAWGDVFQEIDVATRRIRQVKIEDTHMPLLKNDMVQPFRNGVLIQSGQEGKTGIYFVNANKASARRLLSFSPGQVQDGSLYTDGKRYIFLRQAGNKGVLSFTEKNGVWERVAPPLDSIETKLFWYNGADDTYWVTTGKELVHYNNNYKLIKRYTSRDGLPSRYIMQILPDKRGNLWFHTDRSIHELDTRTGKITQMTELHGFQRQNFTFPCLPGIDGLGNLYFPAGWQYGQGFDVIRPDKLRKDYPPSSVYLQTLTLNGLPFVSLSGVNELTQLSLKHSQNRIAIETGVIDFFSGGKSSIRYKLEGINDNWQYAPAYYTIRYDGLPPGNYRLRIQAANVAGDYNAPVKSLQIVIAAPFWNRWWFYSLCVLLIAAAVYGLFQYRMHQILRTTKMRTAISSDLHDEVGATLSSISIFSEMAKQAVAPSSPAERYLQRIGERSRESIEKMSDIIWSVNPEHDNLQQMLLRMKTYVNEIFEAKDTAVHWQVPEAVEYVKLEMTQRKNFYLVFKEVVTNAAKYSRAKNIFICLSVAGKTVSLLVKDDGAGFEKQQVRQGNGLKNIQQRATLLRGRVSVETCINRGTAIAFQFPFAS